ncbi:cytochrome c oxidase accessory protein CcoG [Aquabacterium olei]|uniref:Cytochrome c oxidase accessory protein CcoG n=1 Tax=Aquabacterium olei TaxID=1296669 RepID=A0A2U8FS78_9BURK|nr:cytochrome c oxidase accessory protein CcoG [Aquabacterium olei]AWI53126.1 cytochrome c oxidase accessory protein CcoG [Aquabacterium olei]
MSEPASPSADTKRVIPIQPAASQQRREETVSLYKKTEKIYAREVSGWFSRWRWVLVWVTQIVFYGTPWLMWNDRQAVLFDLGTRRFYLFNLVLYPQDLIYLTALLMISAYGLFLFTAVAGRLWCGYACPQSVYTEIFMWIERKIEGDRTRRMKLDKAPWSIQKVLRKTGKQVAWITVSLWTGYTFVGYFTPIRELAQAVISFGLGPWESFWILFYGFATYGNAGYMREQVCKYMCPYARFQSAMFDRDTLIISYDEKRGEPRGSRSRKTDAKAAGKGDCIDCTLCVQVCPTGIDIRKGLQYECIGCAACIDVCDSVMDKMGTPRGLIRYATENSMDNGWGRAQMWARVARPRVLIYTAILFAVIAAFMYSIYSRPLFRVDIVRDRGALARVVDDGYVENVYRVQLMNASEQVQRYRIGVEQLTAARVEGGENIVLGPAEARWVPVAVRVPPEVAARMGTGANSMTLLVEQLRHGDRPQVDIRERTTFMVPR